MSSPTRARSFAGGSRWAGFSRVAWVPAVMLLAAGARMAYLASDRANFTGDEAVTGIMVRDILHGATFAFYPGQQYGGTLEVYLQALGYLIFRLPQNPLTLRLAQVVLSATTTALILLCARRMLPTRRQAVFAAAFFAIGPWFNVQGGATALGFYVVGATLGTGALYCALRLSEDRLRNIGWMFGLGLCGGLGFWNSLTSVYLILPALIWALPYLVREFRALGAAVIGFGVGAAPALQFMVQSHELPVPVTVDTPTSVGQRLANLVGPVLREFLGIAYAHAEGGLPHWVQDLIVAGVVVVYCVCLWRRRRGLLALLTLRRDRREPVDLLLVAPVLVVVLYVSSPMASYTGSPRYLFTAYPLLALSVAALLPHRHPSASHVVYLVVVGLSAVLCLAFFRTRPDPSLDERDAVLRRVAAVLVSGDERRVYADYWTAMGLQYVAGDSLDVAVCHGPVRFPQEQARVGAAPRPVYVASLLVGSGLVTDPPDVIRNALLDSHAAFRTTRVGFVEIYDRLAPAVPASEVCR